MKLRELVEKLQELDQDLEVVISKDSEGNTYSPLDGWNDDILYFPNGEVFDTKWSAHDACFEYEDEWEEFKVTNSDKNVIVFYPVD